VPDVDEPLEDGQSRRGKDPSRRFICFIAASKSQSSRTESARRMRKTADPVGLRYLCRGRRGWLRERDRIRL